MDSLTTPSKPPSNHEVEYFGDIEGAEGFWDFMTGPFYDNVLSSGDSFMDSHNQLVGAVAIRQVRVHERETCGDGDTLTRDSEAVCYNYGEYDRTPLVVNGTEYEWTVFDHSGQEYGTLESPIWRRYPFEGIVEYLPANDATAAADTLAWMRDNEWIDSGASAVFVDYTVHNPSLQRLVAVELVIELPETGLALPRSRVVVLPRLDWLTFTFDRRTEQVGAHAMVAFVMLFCTLGLLEEIYELGQVGRNDPDLVS